MAHRLARLFGRFTRSHTATGSGGGVVAPATSNLPATLPMDLG